jgi:hypothetical protein
MPGSLAHFFNAATAFRNLVRLCGMGGVHFEEYVSSLRFG